MRSRESTAPITFFFLDLPSGISSGFASITLPFILTKNGFSVATASSIVAIGLSANLWRFLWGPVADLTLTARRWFLIGLAMSAVTILWLGLIPMQPKQIGLIIAVTFISQVASTFVMLPLGGLMAHTVPEEAKGRASGWYQAGNLGGNGIGGGAGVWLASHFSKEAAAGGLAVAMIVCGIAVYFARDVRLVTLETVMERLRLLGRDLWKMARSAIPLFTIVLVSSPIGAGAMNNVWSAVAPDWHTGPDTVAFVTGILNGLISAVGCVVGGWAVDRIGRWWAYFGSGILIAWVALVMAVAIRTPLSYSVGVLAYSFFCGMVYAAFSAVVLFAIGRGAASTKYAALCSLGNLPVVYMTAIDGWTHDRFGVVWMLLVDALSGGICIVFALVALQMISRRQESA